MAASAILVTGGAGYIGSHTVLQLLNSDFTVVALDNLVNSSEVAIRRVVELAGDKGKNLTFHQVDLRDRKALDGVFSSTKFYAVIHFAGLKAVGESVQKPLLYYNNNLIGTITLLEVMAAHGCKKLVFSSSATVYGWPKEVPCTEDFPLSAANPYGRTKLIIEEICRDIYTSDSSWKIILLRYFNPVGAHPSGHIGEDPCGIPNNLMPYIQQVAVGRRPAFTVYGTDYKTKDGTGVRDYLHVLDLADGHIVALQKLFKDCKIEMGSPRVLAVVALPLLLCLLPQMAMAQLKQNYYANICPNVENIVRNAVTNKFQQTFVTVPATLRLFFHDCMVQGCDASIMVASTGSNMAEKDHPDNLSLAGDGFDTVIKAKAAVDAVPQCRNKVSCADILAMAARDVIALAGGPNYAVELGRKDGLSSTATSVNGRLPQPNFDLNKLTFMFAQHGLSQNDMIALSAAHTLGFSHCGKFSNRVYNFLPPRYTVDPTMNKAYVSQLRGMCPKNVDSRVAINMDPVTPRAFDNQYFKNLQRGMGLLTSDQVLFNDARSRPAVNFFASSPQGFNQAFVSAMTKLGRAGVKTGPNGNIRRDCAAFN